MKKSGLNFQSVFMFGDEMKIPSNRKCVLDSAINIMEPKHLCGCRADQESMRTEWLSIKNQIQDIAEQAQKKRRNSVDATAKAQTKNK